MTWGLRGDGGVGVMTFLNANSVLKIDNSKSYTNNNKKAVNIAQVLILNLYIIIYNVILFLFYYLY